MTTRKSSVKVTIVGEEYTIRSDESPEHTREVARYVDETIRNLMNSGAVVESHKAAILAALRSFALIRTLLSEVKRIPNLPKR